MTTLHADPRAARADDWPAAGTDDEKLEFLLEWAVLAPSGHNAQPWRFRVRGGAVEVYADRARALPVVDPRDRELMIGCGAALFHLRLAMRRFGRVDEVETFPSPGDRDHVATVRMGEPAEPTPEILRLFEAIPRRHTHRGEFRRLVVDAATRQALVQAAEDEGAWLMPVEGGLRPTVALLVRQGDEAQFADPGFRRELAAWVRPNRAAAADGIPGYAMGIPDIVSPLAPALLGAVNLGAMWGGRSHQAAESAPLLAALGTPGDEPADWLAAGQALARVLLAGQAMGLQASFLNQPVEVAPLRDRLRGVLGVRGWPQLLLRVGWPRHEDRPTPRRAVVEVMEVVAG